jgi:prepilin-type N-terminal cleavage/methylation domain-containing protein
MYKRDGFTLIELLVVIAIIALLMSILMPALSLVKDQAKSVICQSRLHQWGLIFFYYTSDHKGLFPANAGGDYNWVGVSQPYVSDQRLWFCTKATKTREQGAVQPLVVYEHWQGINGSYGLNDWVLSPWPGISEESKKLLWRTLNVKGAARVPMFLDSSIMYLVNPQANDSPPAYEGDVVFGSGPSSGEMKRFCVNRHNRHSQGVFLDLATHKLGLKELWTLKWHREFDTGGPWTRAGGATAQDWPDWMRDMTEY